MESFKKAAAQIFSLLGALLHPDSDTKYVLQLGHERIQRIAECSCNRSLLALLQTTQVSPFPHLVVHATDDRDRLFSLMGIAQGRLNIEVDYTKDYKSIYQT